jgi:hypothetical protein
VREIYTLFSTDFSTAQTIDVGEHNRKTAPARNKNFAIHSTRDNLKTSPLLKKIGPLGIALSPILW